MRKIFVFMLLVSFLLFPAHLIFAQEQDVTVAPEAIKVQYEQVNPGDGFNYVFKRFKEKLSLAVLFYSNKKKVGYYEKLVASRLAELKYVVEKKDMANFENATTRYFATVGQFADFLVKNGSTDQKSQAAKNLSLHIPVLEDLRDTFEGQEKAEWRFMQDDINYVKVYTDQLQK